MPTATAALDDGARLNGFTWDADWFSSFSDFSVKQVAADAATMTQFWGLAVNFQFSQTGGCTTKVDNGDEVLWVFDAFSKLHVLKLAGPTTATTGTPVSVRVTDGQDGSPAAGATVNGTATGADGRAAVSFAERRASTSSRPSAPTRCARTRSRCASTRPAPSPCTSGDDAAPSVAPACPDGCSPASAVARGRC